MNTPTINSPKPANTSTKPPIASSKGEIADTAPLNMPASPAKVGCNAVNITVPITVNTSPSDFSFSHNLSADSLILRNFSDNCIFLVKLLNTFVTLSQLSASTFATLITPTIAAAITPKKAPTPPQAVAMLDKAGKIVGIAPLNTFNASPILDRVPPIVLNALPTNTNAGPATANFRIVSPIFFNCSGLNESKYLFKFRNPLVTFSSAGTAALEMLSNIFGSTSSEPVNSSIAFVKCGYASSAFQISTDISLNLLLSLSKAPVKVPFISLANPP